MSSPSKKHNGFIGILILIAVLILLGLEIIAMLFYRGLPPPELNGRVYEWLPFLLFFICSIVLIKQVRFYLNMKNKD
jgi:hypothetical protein